MYKTNKNLYGDNVEVDEVQKYALRIVSLGVNQCSFKIVIDFMNRKERELGEICLQISFHKNDSILDRMFGHDQENNFVVGGYYAIFDGEPASNNCLYVGYSGTSIEYRVKRFVKELLDISHPDEGHSGATKARKDNINPHNLYVKKVSLDMLPDLINDRKIDESIIPIIDEYIAYILRSKYNTKVRQ